MEKRDYTTIDEYINGLPGDVQHQLKHIRSIIAEAAPEAQEAISYRMPAFKLNNKVLVYFAAFKNHIGFFPTGSGVEAFKDELTGYKTSKGTIQLPLGADVPKELIQKIVKFRMKEVSGSE